MSGHLARKGFRFQDLYLLVRVLEAVGKQLDESWRQPASNFTVALDSLQVRFGIEASARNSTDANALDWDVLVSSPEQLELAEVKSGAVEKDDRLAFWNRLRGELTASSSQRVVPVLVVDPDVAGELATWTGLAALAGDRTKTGTVIEPVRGNVTNSQKLLQEALWCLCGTDPLQESKAVELKVAQDALARFTIQTFRAESLDERVEGLLEILFSTALSATYEPLLLGWLAGRATAPKGAHRFFTVRDLFAEIGVLAYSTAFNAEKLQRWRNLWREVPEAVRARTRGRLGISGRSIPSTEIQPAAVEALTRDDPAALLVRGIGGAGKSTFVAQAVSAAEGRAEFVLWCGADDVSLVEIDELVEAFRFRSSLSLLRDPSAAVRLFVDGLDDASTGKRERWAELLSRLPSLKNARIVASIREAVWRADGGLQQKLGAWRLIDLTLWPEVLVRKLLGDTKFATGLPSSVVGLLRTPILLDLFWRTFVESLQPDLLKAARLRSRHELLAAFWEERLLKSPRYAGTANVAQKVHDVSAHAAASVGPFTSGGQEAATVQMLLSEGVLVEEGRLQPRLNFRHPLLRDFAFAQWCVAAHSAADAASRWRSVKGGLQRYGTLRAIAEALSSLDATSDYPSLTLPDFLRALIENDSNAADQVAQFLGSLEKISGLDPYRWPSGLKAVLPANFGNAVLAAARLNENPVWGLPSEQWPNDSTWLDDRFPNELWQYAEWLREKTKNDGDLRWRDASISTARKLRVLAEEPRFAAQFAAADRWLTMQAVCCVARALPDVTTLSWLEREMPRGTWRTRAFALEHLVNLAGIDAIRTANLYRVAVGLVKIDGQFQLDAQRWGELMPEQAINWSLAGEDKHRSLLGEFPAAFFPVAVELAEALFRHEIETRETRGGGIADLMEAISPGSTSTVGGRETSGLVDLIDDMLDWAYWRNIVRGDPRERCLEAMHRHAEIIANSEIGMATSVVIPALRRSRLGSVQSIALDVLLNRETDVKCRTILRDALLDPRLYFVSGIDYWLERNLVVSWSDLSSNERDNLQNTIATLLLDESWADRAKSLLARLPVECWRPELQTQRPADGDIKYRATPRPTRRDDADDRLDGGWLGRDEENDEKIPGIWPDSLDRANLLEFYRASFALGQGDPGIETVRTHLPKAAASGIVLGTALKDDVQVMLRPENSWVWEALERTLNRYRKLEEGGDKKLPPYELTNICGLLGLMVVRDVPTELPGKLPEGDVWSGFRENSWTRALRLLDEALTWEPLASDTLAQEEFINVLEQAFATKNPLVQLTCCIRVRPWHWLRTPVRRSLFRRLVWETPTEAKVLQWSLGTALRCGDVERTEIFRLILGRTDLSKADELTRRLGEYIGNCSLFWFDGGTRSLAADLTREIVAAADRFPLLKEESHLRAFWSGFAFGLKERAKLVSSNATLAGDYGNWMLAAWRELVSRRKKRNESEGVVVFATHWLERKESTHENSQIARPWWESIQPLLTAVVSEGGTPDCFILFFNLRDGEFNYVCKPEDVISLVETWADRIIGLTNDKLVDLDATDRVKEEHHSWRECAEYAASSIDALNKGGLLRTDLQRDRAHRLLTRLASVPIRSGNAGAALHALQKE